MRAAGRYGLSMIDAEAASNVTTVLIVEDDPVIGHHLTVGLRNSGYRTTWCRTGNSGLIEARETKPSVVLLDLGLPDADGVDVARSLRDEHPELLLIITTARHDEIDVVVGLDAGADDYLSKPFSLTVLLARLRAHLRRRPQIEDQQMMEIAELVIDVSARRCHLAGHELALRAKEFDLLLTLASHAGRAVSREDLMSEVWDEHWFGSTKTLDVTMASLRRRMAELSDRLGLPVGATPQITTLRGHGYRLGPR